MALPVVLGGGDDRLHYAFDGTILVNKGDLVYHTGDDVKPASSQADQGSQIANQIEFARRFAGVAQDTRLLADVLAVTKFSVSTDITMEVDCTSATFEVGDMVAAVEHSGGTYLEDQKVVKTLNPALCIGKVIERVASAATRVKVRFISKVQSPTVFSPEQVVTPAADSGVGSVILPSSTQVSVAAVTNDANDWIVLPALATVPRGHTITILCNAGGNFEMRTPASSNEEINSEDCDGTKEYLMTDTQVVRVIKISDTIGWMAHGFSAIGAVVAAVVPD